MRIASRLAFLAPIVLAAAASGQDSPPPPTPTPLWSGKGELSFVSTSGNSDTQTLGVGAEVEYKPGFWSFLFKSAFVRSEADDVENARSFLATLRAARSISPRLEAFARGEYLQNTFAGIDSRIAGEGGIAYALFPDPPNKLKVEAGLGYARENRVTGEDLAFPSGRGGLLYEWQISKRAVYTEELSFTQDLEEGENWRILNTGSLTAEVTTVLSLKLSFAITYANLPPPGFGKRDTTTSAAVVAKF